VCPDQKQTEDAETTPNPGDDTTAAKPADDKTTEPPAKATTRPGFNTPKEIGTSFELGIALTVEGNVDFSKDLVKQKFENSCVSAAGAQFGIFIFTDGRRRLQEARTQVKGTLTYGSQADASTGQATVNSPDFPSQLTQTLQQTDAQTFNEVVVVESAVDTSPGGSTTCTDASGWSLSRNSQINCQTFAEKEWCAGGEVGPQWQVGWSWQTGTGGLTARDACCVCGRTADAKVDAGSRAGVLSPALFLPMLLLPTLQLLARAA